MEVKIQTRKWKCRQRLQLWCTELDVLTVSKMEGIKVVIGER